MKTFDEYFEQFKKSATWLRMVATVEDSPWHRESNVAVHTEMCLAAYESTFAHARTPQQNKIAKFALLFHDTGKPAAQEVLEKKDGSGVYRRYAGHEQDSAVTFTELYVGSRELQSLLTHFEARAVRWIIEHHLPYGMKDKNKRQGLRNATLLACTDAGLKDDETFFDCLRSDARGRISDDHAEKLANVETWIAEFKAIEAKSWFSKSMSTMFILIGPSGSGKTSWRQQHAPDAFVISHDDMKVDFWCALQNETEQHLDLAMSDVDVYRAAWHYCTLGEGQSEFKKYVQVQQVAIMAKAKAAHGDVVIDIVNASKKKRTQFVEMGRRAGMFMVAVEFWNSFDELVARQGTRVDKSVPPASIRAQMQAMTCAWLGYEVDRVTMEIGK